MKPMKTVVVSTLVAALVSVGAGGATPGLAQTSAHQQDIEKRLSDKRAEAEAHRKQMEAIKDPDRLSVEMRKHFQMTEDILALMLERRKMTDAQTLKTAPASPAQPVPGMGGMQGPGMGGMMHKEMGGMQKGEKGTMAPQSPATPPAPAAKNPDAEQMMQRLTEHSKYMETMQDRVALNQEMLRHQKMLDQMLELMQQ